MGSLRLIFSDCYFSQSQCQLNLPCIAHEMGLKILGVPLPEMLDFYSAKMLAICIPAGTNCRAAVETKCKFESFYLKSKIC